MRKERITNLPAKEDANTNKSSKRNTVDLYVWLLKTIYRQQFFHGESACFPTPTYNSNTRDQVMICQYLMDVLFELFIKIYLIIIIVD